MPASETTSPGQHQDVRNIDAAAYDQSRQTLAEKEVKMIKTAVERYREEHSIKRLILSAILVILSTSERASAVKAVCRPRYNVFVGMKGL